MASINFTPKKNLWIDSAFDPPRRKYQKIVPLEKTCGFFHGLWLFPSIPRAKKNTEFPDNGTCAGLGRGWLFPELFLGAWEKIGQRWKNSMATLENTRPRSVFFYCKIPNIDHFSWIQMNHMNRNNWLWHHAVHGTAKQNTSFKNNLLPSFNFPVTWIISSSSPLNLSI